MQIIVTYKKSNDVNKNTKQAQYVKKLQNNCKSNQKN